MRSDQINVRGGERKPQRRWVKTYRLALLAALRGALRRAARGCRARRTAARAPRPARPPGRLPSRQRCPARGRTDLRQRALLPRQPERPLRPRDDAEPAQLLRAERQLPLEQPHAADRAHRRRHPDYATPASTATATACRSPTATRPTTPTARPTRPGRSPTGPTPSTTLPAHRQRPRHEPVDGLLGRCRPRRRASPRSRPDHPGPLGPLHPRGLRRRRRRDRQHGAREHRRRHPEGLRRDLAGGRSSLPPTPTASRTPRPPTTSESPSIARRQQLLHHRQRGQVRADGRDRDGRPRPAPRRARWLQRLPGAVRPPLRRPAARRGDAEPDPQGYQVTNAAGNLVDLNGNQINGAFLPTTRASPASAPSTPPRRSPTWPTWRSRASP